VNLNLLALLVMLHILPLKGTMLGIFGFVVKIENVLIVKKMILGMNLNLKIISGLVEEKGIVLIVKRNISHLIHFFDNKLKKPVLDFILLFSLYCKVTFFQINSQNIINSIVFLLTKLHYSITFYIGNNVGSLDPL